MTIPEHERSFLNWFQAEEAFIARLRMDEEVRVVEHNLFGKEWQRRDANDLIHTVAGIPLRSILAGVATLVIRGNGRATRSA